MISQANLEVQLTLDDKLTAGINRSFSDIEKNVERVSKSIRSMGQDLIKVGRDMTFLGAAIAGPLALAFKTTSDYSMDAGNSLKNLSAITISLQQTIGTAMIPVIDKFTVVLKSVDDWLSALDPRMRSMVVQGLMIAAAFLVIGGATVALVGHFAKLTSAVINFVLANAPLLVVVGILIAIIMYWEKARDVVLPIIRFSEIAVLGLAIGYEKLALALTHVLAFTAAMAGQQNIAVWFEEQAILINNNIDSMQQKMTDAFAGKGLAESVDTSVMTIKQKFTELMNFFSMDFTTSIDTSLKQFGLNFAQAFKQAYDMAMNLGGKSAAILIGQVNQLSQGFGDSVGKMIVEGKNFGESMKEVFRSMAEAFISAVVSMIAQWLAFQALKAAVGFGFFGLFHQGGQIMHSGGPIRAHSGLAVDEVPIIAQTGEGVLSRKGMSALGGAGVLNSLNSGKGGGKQVYVNIENASFATRDDAEDTLQRLSRLIEEKSRSRIR